MCGGNGLFNSAAYATAVRSNPAVAEVEFKCQCASVSHSGTQATYLVAGFLAHLCT